MLGSPEIMHGVLIWCVISFVLSLVLFPLCNKLCRLLGCVDEPGARKIHKKTVPLSGGPTIMFPLILLFAAQFLPTDVYPPAYSVQNKVLYLCVFWAFGIGLVDDIDELRPLPKFMLQLALLVMLMLADMRFVFIENLWVSYIVSSIWIFVVLNAFNFLDNMNGLCSGLGILGGLAFFAINMILGSKIPGELEGVGFFAFLMIVFSAALIGFLPKNYPKAKAFLGDSGSHLVGCFMACGSVKLIDLIYVFLKGEVSEVKVAVGAILPVLLILLVPLYDFFGVMLIRLKNGKAIYQGDTNHTSHRLVRRGWTQAQAVGIIWAWMFGFCVLGVVLAWFVI